MVAEPKFDEILRRLADEGVEAIVVGMTAAVLQGAPVTTWDLDIVHRRTADNVERLVRVLRDVNAVARHDRRKLEPGPAHLMGPGHVLTETRFGDFDCLGTIDNGRAYEDLVAHSIVLDLSGRPVRVLSLHEILAIKKRAGRRKDLAVIPLLEATIEEIDETLG